MKKFFVVCCALMCSGIVMAQELKYGVHAGVTSFGYNQGKERVVYGQKNQAGYFVGGDIIAEWKSGWMLASGLNLLQTGGEFSTLSSYYTPTAGGASTEFSPVKTKQHAIEIPLKVGYSFHTANRSFAVIPMLGVYARDAYASSKQTIGVNMNPSTSDVTFYKWNGFDRFSIVNLDEESGLEDESHVLNGFERLDYGVTAEIKCVVLNHYSLGIAFTQGLKEQSNQFEVKNQSFSFFVGYLF